MSDQGDASGPSAGQMRIERLYLKDASFESPGTPSIFAEELRPQNKVDINTTVNSLGDQRHEVVLSITVVCQREGGKTAFVAEVHQAGIFVLEGLDDDQIRRVVGVMCPTTLFPYVREALDNLVVRGGFPPLNLAPINFEAAYAQAMQRHATPESSDVTH